MRTVQVVRMPSREYQLGLMVDGALVQGVRTVEVISDPKQLTRLRVEFNAFDLLGESFPHPTPPPQEP